MKFKKDKFITFSFCILIISFILDLSVYFEDTLGWLKWTIFIFVILTTLKYGSPKLTINITIFISSLYVFFIIFSTIVNSGVTEKSISAIVPYILLHLFYLSLSFSKGHVVLDSFIKAFNIVFLPVIILSTLMIFSSTAYEDSRFVGIFANPNAMAGFSCLFGVTFFRKYLCDSDSTKKTKYYFIILTVVFILILLTKSRASLGVVFSIITVVFFTRKNVKTVNKILATGLILSMFIGMYSYISSISHSDLNMTQRELSDVSNRMPILNGQIESFLNSPLIGAGLVIDKNNHKSRYGGELSYTDILSFSGVIGFFLLFFVITFTLIHLYRRRQSDNYLLLVFVSILLLSLFEGYISNVGSIITFMFWALLSDVSKKV